MIYSSRFTVSCLAAALMLMLAFPLAAQGAGDLNALAQQAKSNCSDIHSDNRANEDLCKKGVDEAMKQITMCLNIPEECGMNAQKQVEDGGLLLTQRCDSINPKGDRAAGALGVSEAAMWYGCTDLIHLYSKP